MVAGVVARKRSYLPYIQRALTSDAVAKYFAHLLEQSSQVERLEIKYYKNELRLLLMVLCEGMSLLA